MSARSYLILLAAALCMTAASPPESAQAKIDRALSAGPPSVAANATVMDMDAQGKMSTLRKGTNGYTCFPGHPGTVGDPPMCADEQAMIWVGDLMGHKPKPTNTKPGIMYMLAGARDWSASDPFATSGTPITEPPHWMIMWPYDASSGLPTGFKDTGTWIMWAGTPWAHLMINQKP